MTPEPTEEQKNLTGAEAIEVLRHTIREMMPIMDWAAVQAGQGEGNRMIQQYIEKTSKLVRENLDRTLPEE